MKICDLAESRTASAVVEAVIGGGKDEPMVGCVTNGMESEGGGLISVPPVVVWM